jgi:BASS family bile acid:Na+ symporter
MQGHEVLLALSVRISLIAFMVGSLLDMGLELRLRDALAGLANHAFLLRVLAFGFVAGPALAWAIGRVVSLDPSYATGLLLVGLTPCAPFLPALVRRANGDTCHAAAMMLVAALGTVVVLPVAAPLVAEGLTVDAWTVTRPILMLVLLPLLVGMGIFALAPRIAAALHPWAKGAGIIAALALLALCFVVYGHSMAATFGDRVIAAEVLFLGLLTLMAYRSGGGLAQRERSVLGLGMCTRNLGAALAPLLAMDAPDERAVVAVVLALPVQLVCAVVAARVFARLAQEGGAPCRSG